MPAPLHWVLADVTVPDGTRHEKVSAVVHAASGHLVVKRRTVTVLDRRDVTAVVDTGPRSRRVEFADGTSIDVERVAASGGCQACGH